MYFFNDCLPLQGHDKIIVTPISIVPLDFFIRHYSIFIRIPVSFTESTYVHNSEQVPLFKFFDPFSSFDIGCQIYIWNPIWYQMTFDAKVTYSLVRGMRI